MSGEIARPLSQSGAAVEACLAAPWWLTWFLYVAGRMRASRVKEQGGRALAGRVL